MAQRLSSIWLALIIALGQFTPIHAAIATAAPAPAASTCCMGDCCCAEMGGAGGCPCAIAPTPEPLNDQRPHAPAPSRDAEHFRAMLDAESLTVAHPAIERLIAHPVTHAQAPRRDPSITAQTLLSVWRN